MFFAEFAEIRSQLRAKNEKSIYVAELFLVKA